MNVAEFKLLLNLYPEDLEIVVPIGEYEYDGPALKVTKMITSFVDGTKYYFPEDGNVVEDGETIEEVLMIN
jgi:hypothetical protein